MIFYDLFCCFFCIKKSCYWFNRRKLLQKAKDRYHSCGGKEKTAEYYLGNRKVLNEKVKNKYKEKRKYGKIRYRKMKENAS